MFVMRLGSMLGRCVVTAAVSIVPLCGLLRAPQDERLLPPPPALDAPGFDDADVEVLTRGPVHEAFAEPVVFDPKPSPLITQAPPPSVEEIPPDERPDGEDVQWIPGYWAWDEGRDDYVWVSGIWREPPPGRQWVPGYWNSIAGGFQWVPGAWVPTEAEQAEYLPEPPASLEIGPNVDPPDQNSIWAPGSWYWQETRYAWRPGYWVQPYPNWVWVPAHYVWTPSGYLFIDGYWDRPLANRGCLFAPVVIARPVLARPRCVFRPTITILATALTTSLFVRPAATSYCFGDYYDVAYARRGIVPWYSFHSGRRGYDPLWSHTVAVQIRSNPNWNTQIREVYRYRRDHIAARPPTTYIQQTNLIRQNNINVTQIDQVVNNTTINNVTVNNVVNNVVVAQPLARVAAAPRNTVKFTSIDRTNRERFAVKAREVQTYQQKRMSREVELRKASGDRPEGARRVAFERSPIVAPIVPAATGEAVVAKQANAASAKGVPVPAGRREEGRRPPARPNQPKADLKAVAKKAAPAPDAGPRPDLAKTGRPQPGGPAMKKAEGGLTEPSKAQAQAKAQAQLEEAKAKAKAQAAAAKAKLDAFRERRKEAAQAKPGAGGRMPVPPQTPTPAPVPSPGPSSAPNPVPVPDGGSGRPEMKKAGERRKGEDRPQGDARPQPKMKPQQQPQPQPQPKAKQQQPQPKAKQEPRPMPKAGGRPNVSPTPAPSPAPSPSPAPAPNPGASPPPAGIVLGGPRGGGSARRVGPSAPAASRPRSGGAGVESKKAAPAPTGRRGSGPRPDGGAPGSPPRPA
ncbi:MAG: hypothetical protein SFX72_11830 [Isosphaeraceae bacterium]|nr:hypothetical protein [Isosphaeraceae bacterium]